MPPSLLDQVHNNEANYVVIYVNKLDEAMDNNVN